MSSFSDKIRSWVIGLQTRDTDAPAEQRLNYRDSRDGFVTPFESSSRDEFPSAPGTSPEDSSAAKPSLQSTEFDADRASMNSVDCRDDFGACSTPGTRESGLCAEIEHAAESSRESTESPPPGGATNFVDSVDDSCRGTGIAGGDGQARPGGLCDGEYAQKPSLQSTGFELGSAPDKRDLRHRDLTLGEALVHLGQIEEHELTGNRPRHYPGWPCHACQGEVFRRLPDGPWICDRCHPSPTPDNPALIWFDLLKSPPGAGPCRAQAHHRSGAASPTSSSLPDTSEENHHDRSLDR